MSIFDVNNPFWRFMNKMTDQFLLSLLWILCGIPIVTIGASTAAFFSVSMQLHKDEEGGLVKTFFGEFRRNLGRATLVWLTQLMSFVLIAVDLWFCYQMNSQLGWFLFAVIAVLALFFVMICLYLWPLLSRSSASLRRLWPAAAYTTVAYLPHSVAMLLLIGLGVVIAGYFSYIAPVIPSIVCYQFSRIYVWIFESNAHLQTVLKEREDA